MIQFFALFDKATAWLKATTKYQAGYAYAMNWLERGATPEGLRKTCDYEHFLGYRVGVDQAIHDFTFKEPAMRIDETIEFLKNKFKGRSAFFPFANCKECGEPIGFELAGGQLKLLVTCDHAPSVKMDWRDLVLHINTMPNEEADLYVDRAFDESKLEKVGLLEPVAVATVGCPILSEPSCVKSTMPAQYRLAKKPDNTLVLQGLFTWQKGLLKGAEWEDLPTVELGE